MQGLLCKLGLGITQPKFSLHQDCPPDVQETLWCVPCLLPARSRKLADFAPRLQQTS
jgi:hypothetical protein